MQLTDLRAWIDEQQPAITKALQTLVNINTYTANKNGVDEGMDELSRIAQGMGFTVEAINGRHRLIRRSKANQSGPRILLISHMDTVFPPDDDFQTYQDIGEGFVRGPGVGDIKGGLVIGLWAMLALGQLVDKYDVQMIISADEENGSPTIRDWYLGGHVGADVAIGLEPGFPQGELTPTVPLGVVYQRRGYGAIYWTVHGEACHSGSAHLGLNAVEAAAQRITRMHALSQPDKGMSVTVGMVKGGISPNTVAGEVKGSVSWRFERQADGDDIREALDEILSATYVVNEEMNLHDSAEYHIDAFIPPMEASDANQALVDVVMAESERLALNNVPIARGGGSDANFISASGTPSICGMGAPAQGIHTHHEKIYLPGLFDRVELLSSVLYRLVTQENDA